ncbi:MAG: hypothetical protein ACLFUG_08230, partial [Nitriliruptoraceae bacterium]
MHEAALVRVPVAGGVASVLELGASSGQPVVLVPGLSDGLAPVDDPAARGLYASVPLPLDRFRGLVVSYRDPVAPGVTTCALAEDLAEVLRVADVGQFRRRALGFRADLVLVDVRDGDVRPLDLG